MSVSIQLSRRTLLRGLGTAVALPALEAMLPRAAFGASAAAAAAKAPTRVAWCYVPNGVNVADWTPKAVRFARAGLRGGTAGRLLRQRLFLRLFVEHLVENRIDAGGQRGQSAVGLRAALCRRTRQ